MTMSTHDPISVEQAYAALFWFLHAYWERGKSEEIAILLGDPALRPDGKPMDPAMTEDWLAAVEPAKREPPPTTRLTR